MADREPQDRPEFLQYYEFYDEYPRIEEEFQEALTVSLNPRGPDFVYHVVAGLGLPRGAHAVDVGCGEGEYSLELARRFGFVVDGVDPLGRHIELAGAALGAEGSEVRELVRFREGWAEDLPFDDATVDLVWCREMLYHVPVLADALREFRRILRPFGRVVIYQLYGTDRLEPGEAGWFWRVGGGLPENADRGHMEASIAAAGLRIDENIELASETGEWAEEQHGKGSRELLAASRLLREPQRYIERFGQPAYDIKLMDAFWHVWRMIGKLSTRIYVLSGPS